MSTLWLQSHKISILGSRIDAAIRKAHRQCFKNGKIVVQIMCVWVVGVGRVRNSSSHEPPEPLTLKSMGFDFRANRVNSKFFESKLSQS